MRKYDLISSLFLFLTGLWIAVASMGLPVGKIWNPGPGFVPLLIGSLLAMVSFILLVRKFLQGSSRSKPFWLDKRRWPKVLSTVVFLAIYIVVLPLFGFLLTTLFIMIFLFKAVGELDWKFSIGGAILTSSLSYLLFKFWLGVQFPGGPWGM